MIPTIYLAGAGFVWHAFSGAPPDGLANIGIVIYTLPVVLVGTFLLKLEFPYVPGGYYLAHALYFWPSVVLLAATVFLVFHALQNRTRPKHAPPSDPAQNRLAGR